jgi:hypothetical protein
MYSKWRRPYLGSSDEAHLFLYSRFIKRPPWLLLYLIKRGGRPDAGSETCKPTFIHQPPPELARGEFNP